LLVSEELENKCSKRVELHVNNVDNSLKILKDLGIKKYSVVDWLINKTGIVQGFSIENYIVESNIQYMLVGINNEYIVRAMLVGAVFIAVTMIASMRVLNKKDI